MQQQDAEDLILFAEMLLKFIYEFQKKSHHQRRLPANHAVHVAARKSSTRR